MKLAGPVMNIISPASTKRFQLISWNLFVLAVLMMLVVALAVAARAAGRLLTAKMPAAGS